MESYRAFVIIWEKVQKRTAIWYGITVLSPFGVFKFHHIIEIILLSYASADGMTSRYE